MMYVGSLLFSLNAKMLEVFHHEDMSTDVAKAKGGKFRTNQIYVPGWPQTGHPCASTS
jgi:hypothetical protein